MAQVGPDLCGGHRLHHMAGMHDDRAVAIFAGQRQVVGDEDNRHPRFGGDVPDEVHDDGLRGHVEAGGRFVGDQKRRVGRQRHGDHHPLAHASRQLERIGAVASLGVRDSNAFEGGDRLDPGLLPRHRSVAHQNVLDLLSDPADRIERGARALEDHRDFPAPQLAHRAFRPEDIGAAERDRPQADAGGLVEKSHDGEGENGLSRSAFTDDAEDFSSFDGESDVFERLDGARARFEVEGKPVDAKQWDAHVRLRGSTMSRRPSPIMLKQKTARTSAKPGKTKFHHSPEKM